MGKTLDDLKLIKKLDKSDQASLISALGEQLLYGWEHTKDIKIPSSYSKTTSVTLCGMGGSAIGADMVTALPAEFIKQPTLVVRNYELPKYVNSKSLVIIVSYSGNTEETIACLKEAQKRKVKIITLAKNGIVQRHAKKHDYPYFKVPDSKIPRASVGYQAGSLLNFLVRTGKLPAKLGRLAQAAKAIETLNPTLTPDVPSSRNIAKQIAYLLYEHTPLVIGAGILEPSARRLKDQFHENSKHFAAFEVFPELNHNLGEGFSYPSTLPEDLVVLMLENDFDHPQVVKRFEVLKKFFKKQKIAFQSVLSVGDDIWSQKFTSVLVGDWISYYLGILNGVDPSPVPNIEWTKKQLV